MMRSLTRAAFSILLLTALFMLLGWVIPFWFSRGTDMNNGVSWNIFYVVVCIMGSCETDSSIITEDKVFTVPGTETSIKPESIAVMAILAFVFCLTSVVLASIFQFGMCGDRSSYYYVILGAFVCMTISGLLDFASIVVAAIALTDFFEQQNIRNAFEFPWSVLLFGIGGVAMMITAILYLYILCHWKLYRHIYSRERYYFETDDGPNPIYSIYTNPEHRKNRYTRESSQYRSYSPPRDYSPNQSCKGDHWADYRREYSDGYNINNYRRSTRPTDRIYPREHRKPYIHYDRYQDKRRYVPSYYGDTRNDRSWHGKLDEVVGEAHRFRMTSANRWRDRDRYYH